MARVTTTSSSAARRSPGSPRVVIGERTVVRRSTRAPATVDLSLTGRCQLRCAWCWGTEHHVGELFAVDRWVTVLSELADRGTRHVVFTGGEPFLSPHLEPLIREAKSLGLRTTLSTNGIRLARDPSLAAILDYADDVGIPIDGHSPEINAVMRERSGRLNGWRHAVDAVKIAEAKVGSITVRTVVSKKNIDSVPLIPSVLEAEGIDISRIRFKVYQVEPIGPHFSQTEWSDWAIDASSVAVLADELVARHPEIRVAVQLYQNTAGRYFRIDPDGRAFGTDCTTAGIPTEVEYGNAILHFDPTLAAWRQHKFLLKRRTI